VESSQVGPYCTDTQLSAECHDRDTRFGSSYETSRETIASNKCEYSGPWKRDLKKQKTGTSHVSLSRTAKLNDTNGEPELSRLRE